MDIIEDCQVPIDNTAYADWLLKQGIPDSIYEPVDNLKPNVVCKIDSQTGIAEATKKVKQTVPKDINVLFLRMKMSINKKRKRKK